MLKEIEIDFKSNCGSNSNEELTPIMSQYKSIKDQYKDYILFFRMGEFYELFYEDALIASNALDIILTSRDKNRSGIPMCGVPAHASNSYLGKLIKLGYRVAVCEQVESPTTKIGSGPLRREVVRLITPGTIIDNDFLEAKSYNFLLAIFAKKNILNTDYGIAFVDVSTGDLFVENHHSSNLKMRLSVLRPKEILISNSMFQSSEYMNFFREYSSIARVVSNFSDNASIIENNILSYYKVKSIESFGAFSSEEMISIGMLFEYIKSTNISNMPYISKPRKSINNDFLEIDEFTQKSLEITDSNSKLSNASLLKTIDYTITAAGGRLLNMRIISPLKNIEMINERLNSVEVFYRNISFTKSIRDTLKSIPDIARLLSRISLDKCNPKDLKFLAEGLRQVYVLKEELINFSSHGDLDIIDGFEKITDKVEQLNCSREIYNAIIGLGDHKKLADLVLNALNEDLPKNINEGMLIADGYCSKLDNMRKGSSLLKKEIEELEIQYSNENKVSSLKIKNNNLLGYFIEVPKSQKDLISYNFVHRQSLTNVIRYSSVELASIENKMRNIHADIINYEIELFQEIVAKVFEARESILTTSSSLAIIDVSSSLGHCAKVNNYYRPIIDNSYDFKIREGRHPIVEKLNDDHRFVTNDCDLSEKTWLLTGPNMAGKSTFLRQNALIIIMGQMGSFVSAKKAHFGYANKIFARIGASDDLARGRSTFMVEMIETATIVNNANSRSFVILDEIGRGTSTYDGMSIAWACLEYIMNINQSRCIFATHYHELTKIPGVSLHTMKIDHNNDEISFLYKIIEGASGKSYGIYAAKSAGMPKLLIDRAEELLKGFE